MPVYLGLDIGSNSVGSAWVDTDRQELQLASSVFPAGVDEQEDKRGAPKNQARREKRNQRRIIRRRALRKRRLARFLVQQGLLPAAPAEMQRLLDTDPWQLRRKALAEPLSRFEFGRVVLHFAQRRGAVGVTTDPDDPEEGKVKEGMDRLADKLLNRYVPEDRRAALHADAKAFAQYRREKNLTVGRLLADLMDERRRKHNGVAWNEPVRNRLYRMPESQLLFAGRELIREEFQCIVEVQRSFQGSELAGALTADLVQELDDPAQTGTWRHRGILFGQRRTYWDTGTLGRCVLEPTDRCAPIGDRHASYFRVVETVNNIRIQRRGEQDCPLTGNQRTAVIRLLRGPLGVHAKGKYAGKPKTSVSVSEIKAVLDIKPRDKNVRLNLEADEEREINTDWFHREIVHGAIGLETWQGWEQAEKSAEEAEKDADEAGLPKPPRSREAQRAERVNRALLKFDPEDAGHEARLRAVATSEWSLPPSATERLIAAWKQRPKLEKRLNLSRRAIVNLLPYMECFDKGNHRWPTQQEARKAYAAVLQAELEKTSDKHRCDALRIAAQRYATGATGLRAADRHYMRLEKHQLKHHGELVCDADGRPLALPPPAPMLSNPVVRKAIHEVRRHLLVYLQKFRRKPDRVVIELARITKQSERRRNAALARNRYREKIRKEIIAEVLPMAFGEEGVRRLSLNQQRAAVDRVILARQQRQDCPYCGQGGLTDRIVAEGADLQIDHIVPYSRSGDDGLNNRVLVHQHCNQGKTNLTPREWWTTKFDERARIAEKLFKDVKWEKGDYFEKRDYARKWDNFTREVREGEEFKNSQLTDTAYAARQVAAYLADALFDGRGLPERGEGEGKQRIFFTVGKFTSMLRRDWQLYETLKPPRHEGRHGDLTAEEESKLAAKNRGDHREHAIDAVAIALTAPDIKQRLATEAAEAAEFYDHHGHQPRTAEQEHCRKCVEYRERHGRWPGKGHIPTKPPWGNVVQFRVQVLAKVYSRFDSGPLASGQRDHAGGPELLIVAHRAVKRRLVGHLHKQTLYGPVFDHQGKRIKDRATVKQPIYESPQSHLKHIHLRLPIRESRDQAVKRVADRLRKAGVKPREARQRASTEVDSPTFKFRLVDPSPGKSGIVRDDALRRVLRKCLADRGLDPDAFTGKQIKETLDRDGPLRHPSGVPVKSAVLLWAINDPVVFHRHRSTAESNETAGDRRADTEERQVRIYDSQNNHHIEIRENSKGKWAGTVVPAHLAASRLRARLRALNALEKPLRHLRARVPKEIGASLPRKERAELRRKQSEANCAEWKRRMRELQPQRSRIAAENSMVDRSENEQGRFVMSLAQGEMIYARRRDRPDEPAACYVVCKVDPSGSVHFAPHWDARKASEQDRWDVAPGDLKDCGPEPRKPPQKIRVSPLGDVKVLEND